MNNYLHSRIWNTAISFLALSLLVTAVAGPRRLPPESLFPQTWSMHWEGSGGQRLSEDFEIHEANPRYQFGPFLHEYHWFGLPTVELPPTKEQRRLVGTLVE